jgi:hypothetical protein
LVTNRTWEHFWLNEGFTVFVERKIIGQIYGKPLADFQAIEGLQVRPLPSRSTGRCPAFCGFEAESLPHLQLHPAACSHS